ncbi:MAG: tetratricopeptide repeat protein [Anaerolineales bacterium]
MTKTPDSSSERRLAAIMFTDMVGFTSLGQRDESLALRHLEEHRGIVRPLLSKHNGREIQTIGDAFLVEFASSLDAVRCAIEIQSALRRTNARQPQDPPILLRIGVHLGDVIHKGNDVAGDAVNVASRIEPLAPPGGLCITAPVYASVHAQIPEQFESIGTPRLKNVASPIEIFRLAGAGSISASENSSPEGRLAVLPFLNISADPADEYFADGMTEELISFVSHTRGLRTIARTSVMRYKGTNKPIADIGRELNVASVLEGSVRKDGQKLRIAVQLIDTASEEPRWSQVYDRQLSDVFGIQTDIAQQVAQALRRHVVVEAPPRPAAATRNTDAYVSYLRGRQLWNKRAEPDLKRAIGFFDASLTSDPKFARAYSGLADTYAALALLEFMSPNEAFPKARSAVSQALALQPDLVEARTSSGLIKFQYDWDWSGAERELTQAIDINPNYPLAHHYYADLLKAMGRFDEAIEQIGLAQELDPLSLAINTGVGHVLYLARQYDRAIEQYQRAVDLDPAFMATHLWFGRPYLEKDMYKEAISELETAVRLSGESTVALAMLGHGLASAGQTSEAAAILEKLRQRSETQYVPSYWIAVVYNGFRDRDQVITWMGRALEERSSWLVWTNVEPRFDWIRADPEFASLVEAMKFP